MACSALARPSLLPAHLLRALLPVFSALVASSPCLLRATSIPNSWIFSTVYIQNLSIQGAGTGFLVSRRISEDERLIYLVSNKHVLAPKPLDLDGLKKLKPNAAKKARIAEAIVLLNKKEDDRLAVQRLRLTLRDGKGREFVKGHTDKNVDVAALNITRYIARKRRVKKDLQLGFIEESRFATKRFLEENFVGIGDSVLVLGYPLHLIEGGHAIPVARAGVISSYPMETFRGERVILIDAAMIRGASGGPVFLPFSPFSFESETKIEFLKIRQAQLLGIQSRLIADWSMKISRTVQFGGAMEEVEVIDTANFGIIYTVETISETIDLFGRTAWAESDDSK